MKDRHQPRYPGKIVPVPMDMDHIYLGPWVPASTVVNEGKSIPKVYEAHVEKINGVPSIPVRLINIVKGTR